MDEYRQKIFRRFVVFCAGIPLSAGLLVLANLLGGSLDRKVTDFIRGFQIGFIAGVMGILVFTVLKYGLALANVNRLKKMYIAETDERKLLIRQKTGEKGMMITIFGLALGTAVSGYFDRIVFMTLLGATYFSIFVKLFFKIYYHKKY